MKHRAEFTLSRKYYSNFYDSFIRYGRKWSAPGWGIGLFFLIFGVGMLLADAPLRAVPIILILCGVYCLLYRPVGKFFFVRRMLRSKTAGGVVSLEFDEEGLRSEGPFSEGRIKWDGIEKVVRTPDAILLWPQTRTVMYVPATAASETTLDFIEAHVT